MNRPVLELLVAPDTVERALPLVRALGAWADTHASDPSLGTPAARLATSPAAPGLDAALRDRSVPVAVLVDADDPPIGALREHGGIACAWSAPRHARDEELDVALPRPGLFANAHPPVSPFVRRRWRRRLGLPDDLVLDTSTRCAGGSDTPTPISVELVTALSAVAAAVVARDDGDVLLALTLAAPTVVDAATASRLALSPGRDVVVADHDRADEARALADDPPRAAVLSRHARRTVEERFDIERAARRLARLLGLVRAPIGTEGLFRALAELATAPIDEPARRALSHCAPILGTAALDELGALTP